MKKVKCDSCGFVKEIEDSTLPNGVYCDEENSVGWDIYDAHSCMKNKIGYFVELEFYEKK